MRKQLLCLAVECVHRLANQPGLGSSRAFFLLGVRHSTAFESRLYLARVRMAHFTLTRSVSEDVLCILAYASG